MVCGCGCPQRSSLFSSFRLGPPEAGGCELRRIGDSTSVGIHTLWSRNFFTHGREISLPHDSKISFRPQNFIKNFNPNLWYSFVFRQSSSRSYTNISRIMVKSSFITIVASAALICTCTAAAGTPDDADEVQTLLRKSTLPNEVIAAGDPDPLTVYEQMMNAQGMERDLQNLRRGNKGPRPTSGGTNTNNNNNENEFLRTVDDSLLDGGCFANPSRCGCEHLKHSDYRGFQSTTTSGHRCKTRSQTHNFP